MMNIIKRSKLAILIFALILISCGEGDDQVTVEKEPITILGKWFFSEVKTELISIEEGAEIQLPNPNISDLTWTFTDDSNLQVQNEVTSFSAWYEYDTTAMRLHIDEGYYDVLQHTKDSLKIRFYTDVEVADFYTYFQLTR